VKNTLIQLIRTGTKKVFDIMIPLDITSVDNVSITEQDSEKKLVSAIDFSGDLYGSIFIHCPLSLASDITAAMLMSSENETIDNEEVKDCLGEVVNIIAGVIRNKLAISGIKTDVSIPVVYSNLQKDSRIDIAGTEKITQFFIINNQPFIIELFYTKEPKVSKPVIIDPLAKKIKATYIKPIFSGFEKSFKEITQTDLKIGNPTLTISPVFNDDIGIHLGITGDLTGKILYSFNKKDILKMVSLMLKKTLITFDESAKSGINEICNILTGNCCSKLYEEGYNCDITPPTMISGKDMNISIFDGDINIIYIPLFFPEGEFGVNIAVKENF